MAKTTRATAEPKTRKRKSDDPAQYERFRQAAREHETDQGEETFSTVFKTIIRKKGIPATSQ
jgi:hypothetical protein